MSNSTRRGNCFSNLGFLWATLHWSTAHERTLIVPLLSRFPGHRIKNRPVKYFTNFVAAYEGAFQWYHLMISYHNTVWWCLRDDTLSYIPCDDSCWYPWKIFLNDRLRLKPSHDILLQNPATASTFMLHITRFTWRDLWNNYILR